MDSPDPAGPSPSERNQGPRSSRPDSLSGRTLAEAPPAWMSQPAGPQAEDARVVLLTRLLCYRNFAGEPFVVSAPPNACRAIADKALRRIGREQGPVTWRLADCPPRLIRLLREREILPLRARAFPGKKGFKHLMAVPGGSSWSLVNEVEHLTAGRIFAGLPAPESAVPGFSPPWEGSDGTIWSRSAAFGFLASDPRRIGPGFSVESIVHLPGLALSRRLANARNYLAAAGVGFLAASAPSAHAAAPGAAEAGLFRLAFGGGWGKSAREVYTAFLNAIRPVLRLELEARARCLDKHRKRLEERAHRSLEGLAANTPLTYAELLAAASIVRLAAETGTMDPRLPGRLEGLRIKAASGHLAVTSGRELSKEEEDFSRANVVRLSLMMDSGEIS